MSITTALARGQAKAASLMTDICVIERKTGETTVGGTVTPTYGPPVYSGPCRVQVVIKRETREDVGQASRVMQRPQLQLPVTVSGVREGDRVTVTAADAELNGKVWVVFAVEAKTHATVRRITLTEVSS